MRVENAVFRALTNAEKEFFNKYGYIVIRNVLSEVEVDQIEKQFDAFMNGDVLVEGKDFCDMSAGFDRNPEEFELVNAMLPRKYDPSLQGNIFELRARNIAQQLLGDDMQLDYDQFLGKKPKKSKAAFAMHQDMAYWPRNTPDTKTATVSLGITKADKEHGCLQVIPGSHLAKKLMPHTNAVSSNNSREDSHAQMILLEDGQKIEFCSVNKGDVTVHNEWIVHGSSGNVSNDWRKTYVIAFRSQKTIDWERSHGFTHSHNDSVNWDTFDALNV